MIADVFRRLSERRETALMPYVTAGFPTLEASMKHLEIVAANGADLIEVGVPFSDPVADGPTIQEASHVALEAGTTLEGILTHVEKLQLTTPLILMSYLNPLLAYGRARVLPDAASAGFRGLIIPDLPAEESSAWRSTAREHRLDLIQLVAPTSTPERARKIAELSDGFIYYVSLTGTTGTRDGLATDLEDRLRALRGVTRKPLAVGFGVSTPEHVRSLRGIADGAVVGSRIIQAIRNGEDLAELIRRLKSATRSEKSCWS